MWRAFFARLPYSAVIPILPFKIGAVRFIVVDYPASHAGNLLAAGLPSPAEYGKIDNGRSNGWRLAGASKAIPA